MIIVGIHYEYDIVCSPHAIHKRLGVKTMQWNVGVKLDCYYLIINWLSIHSYQGGLRGLKRL
jgi:hypothetical protein